MKVMQINCVYRKGSTGKIVYELHKALGREGMESVVCYGRGQVVREKGVYKTCPEWYAKLNHLSSMFTGLMYGGCRFSTRELIGRIRREKPDVVHLHCINGYFVNIYRLISWLKEEKIPTVLTLHAEFMHTGNCAHALDCEGWKTGCGHCPRRRAETKSLFLDGTHRSWEKMRGAFAGFENLQVVSVSPWLMERAKQSPILGQFPHEVIHCGVDTEIFRPYDNGETLKESLDLGGKKIVFHTTAEFSPSPSHLKGGCYVLRLAEKFPETEFLVAGTYDAGIVPPKNLRLLGNISDQSRLAQLYSMADVSLLTSRRETYSMLVAESLCCGTPVVGFQAGGPETIALPAFSRFVPYGDVEALALALEGQLEGKTPVDVSQARRVYGSQAMCAAYLQRYKKEMDC